MDALYCVWFSSNKKGAAGNKNKTLAVFIIWSGSSRFIKEYTQIKSIFSDSSPRHTLVSLFTFVL